MRGRGTAAGPYMGPSVRAAGRVPYSEGLIRTVEAGSIQVWFAEVGPSGTTDVTKIASSLAAAVVPEEADYRAAGTTAVARTAVIENCLTFCPLSNLNCNYF